MTANAFEEDKKKALEAGMNAHIANRSALMLLWRYWIRSLTEENKGEVMKQ